MKYSQFIPVALVAFTFSIPFSPVVDGSITGIVTGLGSVASECVRFIETQTLVKDVKQRNEERLPSLMKDLLLELNQGTNSDLFAVASRVHVNLALVDDLVGKIVGKVTESIAKIRTVYGNAESTQLTSVNARFRFVRTSAEKLYSQVIDDMGLTLRLIDDAKFILSNNVTGDVSWLDVTTKLASQIIINDAEREKERQQNIIDDPPHTYFWFIKLGVNQRALDAAHLLKAYHERKIGALQNIVRMLSDHSRWLEEQCRIIKEQCEDERRRLSDLSGSAKGIALSHGSLLQDVDFSKLEDDEKNEYTVALMGFLRKMNAEATKYVNAKENRQRRSLPSSGSAKSTDTSLDVRRRASGNAPANLVLDLEPIRSTMCGMEKTIILLNVSRSAVEIQLADVNEGLKFAFLSFRSILQQQIPTTTESSWYSFGKSQRQAGRLAPAPSLPDVTNFVSDCKRFLSVWRDNIYKIRDIQSGLLAFADSQTAVAPLNSGQVKWNNRGILEEAVAKKNEVLRTLEDVERDVETMSNKAANIVRQYAGMYENFGCGRNRDHCTELAAAVINQKLQSFDVALVNVRNAKTFFLP